MTIKREVMYISFLSDNAFTQHLCVAMYSLLAHNDHHHCVIYIIDGGISQENKDKIGLSLEKFSNKEIIYITFDSTHFAGFKVTKQIPQVSYNRIMLPALLPTKEKVLYLDCDILINGDIFELYNQSFDGTSLVAIQDRSDHYSSAFIETYGIKNIAYCFNSGIMLLNLQKMREIQAIDKMMASGCNNNLLQLCMDQDLFNLAFTNDRKEVSATRNAHQYFFVRSRNQFDNIDDKEFEEVRKSPKIIHFTGAKPRSSGYIHPFKKLYFTYLAKDFTVKFDFHTYIKNRGIFIFLKVGSLLPRKYYLHLKKQLHRFIP